MVARQRAELVERRLRRRGRRVTRCAGRRHPSRRPGRSRSARRCGRRRGPPARPRRAGRRCRSRRTPARTYWRSPEVSPLHQYSWRLRLQNQVRPVSRVLRSDSSFIQRHHQDLRRWTPPGRSPATSPSSSKATAAISASVCGDRGGGRHGGGGACTAAKRYRGLRHRRTVSFGRLGGRDPRCPRCAPPRPVELTRHGDVRVDPWYWLRDREDPEVIAYLEAENAYTERGARTHAGAPGPDLRGDPRPGPGDRRLAAGPQGPVGVLHPDVRGLAVRGARSPARRARPRASDETVLLDENELADGLDYFSLGGLALVARPGAARVLVRRRRRRAPHAPLPRPRDRRRPARRRSRTCTTGSRGRTTAARSSTSDPTTRCARSRSGGTRSARRDDDVLVYEETDERFFVSVGRARSGRAIVLSERLEAHERGRACSTPTIPTAAPRLVEPRTDELEYDVEHHVDADGGEQLFVAHQRRRRRPTSSSCARRSTRPGAASWTDVVPHRADVKLDDVDVFRDFLVLSERANGLEQLRVLGLADPTLDHVLDDGRPRLQHVDRRQPRVRHAHVPLRLHVARPADQRVRRDRRHRRAPPREAHAGARRLRPRRLHVGPALGDRAPTARRSRCRSCTAATSPLDGTAPALLYGYGSYESSVDPTFSIDPPLAARPRLRVRDRPHPRRRRARTPVVRARQAPREAQHVHRLRRLRRAPVRRGLHRRRIGSARAAAAPAGCSWARSRTCAPTCSARSSPRCRSSTSSRRCRTPTLPLTVTEWEEWGNPLDDPDDYAYMKSYSPYDNVDADATTPRCS